MAGTVPVRTLVRLRPTLPLDLTVRVRMVALRPRHRRMVVRRHPHSVRWRRTRAGRMRARVRRRGDRLGRR